jgi:hypothetical protein
MLPKAATPSQVIDAAEISCQSAVPWVSGLFEEKYTAENYMPDFQRIFFRG